MTEHVIFLTKTCLFAIMSHNFFILVWFGLILTCWGGDSGSLQMKFIREALWLSPEVQKLPCFLNAFSEKNLGAATSNLSLRLCQWFEFKELERCDLCTALSHSLDGKSEIFL